MTTNQDARAAESVALRALRTIAEFPVTDPKNQDAANLLIIARTALRLVDSATVRNERTVAESAEQRAVPAGWWRKRADEIEAAVAQTGSREAMRCYTQMRGILQAVAAAPAAQQAAPSELQLRDGGERG